MDDRDLIFFPLYKVYGCILEDKVEGLDYDGADSFINLSFTEENPEEGLNED